MSILTLGFLLRAHNLTAWPRQGATFDEYAWTWLGINLIKEHTPKSWSRHPQYTKKQEIIYQKTAFTIVVPYLEHPPFFGLVAGAFAIVSGARDMYDVNLERIRPLAVFLGALSIFMIFLLTKELYGNTAALIAALIYATVPTLVIGSRIVQNENFFIPFFLFSLFLISKYLKTKKIIYRNLAAVVCGLLTLAKIPWIAATLGIVLIFMYLRKYKDALMFTSIILPIFSLFIIYGLYFDSKLLVDLWKFQLQRYDITFNGFFALFTSPYLVDRFMIDGWIYFGWFSIILLIAKDIKKNLMVILPFLAYLAIFLFAIPNEPGHGWYRYPLYPFMVIGTALFVKEYFNKNYMLTFLFLIFTGLSMLQLSWEQSFGFSFPVFRIFLLLFGLSLTPLFIPKTKKLSSLTSYVSLLLIFIFNIWTILNYNEQ